MKLSTEAKQAIFEKNSLQKVTTDTGSAESQIALFTHRIQHLTEPRTSFDHSSLKPTHENGLWLNVMDVLATRFVLFNQAVAIRRAAFEKVGGFDESLKYLEDYDLPLRLSLEGPWAFTREPLVIYTGGSAGSFSERALEDPLTLKDCEVAIFCRMLTRIDGLDRYATAHRFLERRIRTFRRGITEIRLTRTDFRGARALARVMSKLSHYEDAVFRRSPWYPEMLTLPL
jgi:hypothetical protein